MYSPPARGRLIHLVFLALRPMQGSNVVGSQPVGQLETGLKIVKIVVHPESRASVRSLPRPPYPIPPPTPVLSELRDRGTIADNHWCCNAPQNPASKNAYTRWPAATAADPGKNNFAHNFPRSPARRALLGAPGRTLREPWRSQPPPRAPGSVRAAADCALPGGAPVTSLALFRPQPPAP